MMDNFMKAYLPPSSNGQVWRGARRFALIAAAGELAQQAGILPWPANASVEACGSNLHQWISGRGGSGAAEDHDAIARVRHFIESHGNSRFEPIHADPDYPFTKVINRAGFWRDTADAREYLFLPVTWKQEVCAGTDAFRVARVLAERGLLKKDSAGKISVPVTLPDGIGKTRCYIVSSTIFDVDIS